MPRRCRRGPPGSPAQARVPALPSVALRLRLYPLARLGAKQPNDQVQPLHLAPGVLVVEFGSRPVGLQAAMVVGVEQDFQVEARSPLVLCFQDRLRVIESNPSDVLGQLAVGPRQFVRGGAQPKVRRINLLDKRVALHRRLLSSTPVSLPLVLSSGSSHAL